MNAATSLLTGLRRIPIKGGSELAPIARELLEKPDLLRTNLPYLCSPEAKSAAVLGKELGLIDSEARFFDEILQTSKSLESSTALVRGYVFGLLSKAPQWGARMNAAIDVIEKEAPAIAFDLVFAAAEVSRPADRLLRLVESGKLPPENLGALRWGGILNDMSSPQFRRLLELLVPHNASPQMLKLWHAIGGSVRKTTIPVLTKYRPKAAITAECFENERSFSSRKASAT